MKPIKNPYTLVNNYCCFGCSPNNVHGLQMTFHEDDDYIISNWKPKNHFQGFINVLHGGIQATLMDEIASWVVCVKLKTSGVTSNMKINYIKPVSSNEDNIYLKAKLIETNKHIATIHVELFNSNQIKCSEGFIDYFFYPENIAKQKLGYPGIEAFIED